MRLFRGLKSRLLLTAAAAATAMGVAAAEAAPPADRPPNIIVVFADDLGYADIGCFGAQGIETPNIDQMAAEGTKFTQFYVASPACSPSRAGLLTGSIPQRVSIPRVLFPADDIGLGHGEITIAELLKTRGYATAHIGKWHLGHHKELLPPNHGFDLYFGLPYSNDMSPDPKNNPSPEAKTWPELRLYRGTEVIEIEPDQTYLTRRFTEEAVAFIEQNRDRPFFLYLPHAMPHVPLYASEPFRGKSPRGLYGDVIAELDWSVGQLLDTLKRLDLDEQTLVVFTSDNGPWMVKGEHGGRADPLRGAKGMPYEGGFRVPAVMWWPGTIPAGMTCTELASTLDFLPTFALLAGAEPPVDRVLDGHDIRPLMMGQPDARSPHNEFFYWTHVGLRAVRIGPWKLHLSARINGRDVPPELYNLDEDIGERNNRIDEHPALAQRLWIRAMEHQRELERNTRPPQRIEPN